jgi:hypothetical protein
MNDQNDSDQHDSDQHHPVDPEFEARALAAGAALRRPAPDDLMARLHGAQRRRRVVQGVGALALALLVVGTAVALRPDSRRDSVPVQPPTDVTGSTAPSTTAPSTTAPSTTAPTTTSTTTSTSTLSNSGETFGLGLALEGVGGLTATTEEDEVSTGPFGGDQVRTLWLPVDGDATGRWVVLRDTEAPPSSSPEGEVSATPIDLGNGDAYIVRDLASSFSFGGRVMWWRPDGRLWVFTGNGLTDDELVELAGSLVPGSGVPHALDDPRYEFSGFAELDRYRSVSRTYQVGDTATGTPRSVVLSVANGGLVQQLADSVPASIETVTVLATDGYRMTLVNGQTDVIWPTSDDTRVGGTDDAPVWYRLTISSDLADRVDDLIAAVQPAAVQPAD